MKMRKGKEILTISYHYSHIEMIKNRVYDKSFHYTRHSFTTINLNKKLKNLFAMYRADVFHADRDRKVYRFYVYYD